VSIINLRSKVIFIRVPKTASTSIGSIDWVGSSNHVKAPVLKKLVEVNVKGITWDDFFKFGFVRNPWDRAVSGYFHDVKNPKNKEKFKEFIMGLSRKFIVSGRPSAQIFEPQNKYIYECKKPVVDFIGRFENLQEDWKHVCDVVGMYEELPHRRKSNHHYYKEYYDEETINKISGLYSDDIEIFNYTY
jgi:chondroitin 4-sulfotransferase 11